MKYMVRPPEDQQFQALFGGERDLIYENVGETIREAMEERGVTIEELAARLKHSPGYIKAIVEGRFPMRVGTLAAFGVALGVRFYTMWVEADDLPPTSA